MRLRRTIGLSLALLTASAPVVAKETPVHHPAKDLKAKPGKPGGADGKAAARHHRERAATAGSTQHRRAQRAGTRIADARHSAEQQNPNVQQQLPPPDQYIGPVMVAGKREIGAAAWYGRQHVGRRTASGQRLDAVHATAAHRSLPLYTLVKVTNLTNGRSVIATINDRGPVSRSLLIDLSPRAAAALDMLHSGIATVSIVPVAPAPATPRAR